jgi:transcriptional regulator with XRE-family HTH domain
MDAVAAVFGRRVRALRLARGLTQEQLGHAAGIDYKHLSAVERGAKAPSFEAIGKLARALGVEYWQLFVPDRRPTSGLDREIAAAIDGAGRLDPADVQEFLRALRSAVRRLDRKGSAGPA